MGIPPSKGSDATDSPGRMRTEVRRLVLSAGAMAVVISIGLTFYVNSRVDTGWNFPELLITSVLFLLFSACGTLIVMHHPENRIGWLLCAFGLLIVPLGLSEFIVWYSLIEHPGRVAGGSTAAWVNSWTGGSVEIAILVLVFFLFPEGHLPSPRWRAAIWITGIAVVIDFISRFAAGPIPNVDFGLDIDNPVGITGSRAILSPLLGIAFVIIALMLLVSIASLVQRFRNADGDERQQLKWLLLAAVVVGAAFVAAPLLWSMESRVSDVLWPFIFAIAVGTIPVAIGIALLKHHLYDIDLLLSRALLYGTLSALVVGAYAFIVGGLGWLLQDRGGFAVSLLAAGVIAVGFQPIRGRVQRSVNRFVYGDRDDPYGVLTQLGRRLEEALSPESVLPAIVRGVSDAFRLPYAAIALVHADGLHIVAAVGSPVNSPTRLNLTYGAETVGELHLAPPRPGDVFSPRDLQLLEDLARQIGVAAHAVQLTADLQAARARLVTTREEERRRLRRDLHDGIGAQMAAMSVQVGVLHKLITRDPDRAAEAAIELRSELRAGVADIRRLVHGLRPPALDELGLIAAIRQRAASYASARHDSGEGDSGLGENLLEVTVDAPETMPELPAAVEVAVYRIVEEALTNVVRHAGAHRVVVRLTIDSSLHLVIDDDGVGLSRERPIGVGLISMQERASELGGRFSITSLPGQGTRVDVQLPLSLEGLRGG